MKLDAADGLDADHEPVAGSGGGQGGQGGQSGSAGGSGSGGATGGSGGGARGDTGGSGGSGLDGSVPIDAVRPADMATAEAGMPPAVCGTSQPTITGITNARGVAIDASGVVYFTREVGAQAWIGRLRPGQALEPSWVPLSANAQLRTLRVDSARALLYVAASGANAVYSVSIPGATVSASITQVPSPHGLAVADDGGVFVSAGDGQIYRVHVDLSVVAREVATAAPVYLPSSGDRPLGIALGPDGYLYVGANVGHMKRLRRQDKQLLAPADYGTFSGTANDLAFDVDGRLYVASQTGPTARPLLQLAPGGAGQDSLTDVQGLLAGLAFGRGPLACQDLYVADAGGALHRHRATRPGIDLP